MKSYWKGTTAIILTLILVSAIVFQISYAENSLKTDLSVRSKLDGAIVIYMDSAMAMVNHQEKQIDPENDMVVPFIQDKRSLVPIRFIAESLGAEVSWHQASKTATITMGNKKIEIKIGSNEMHVNNKEVALDVPAVIKDKRTFVPLRAVSEALGKQVFYDRGLIIISDIEEIFNPELDKSTLNQLIEEVNTLPSVGTKENLIKLLVNSGGRYFDGYSRKAMIDNQLVMEEAMVTTTESDAASAEPSAEHSTTNVQVEGVDESDIVKTDGRYIYQVSDEKVVISMVYPVDAMKIIKTIEFDETSFMPNELYIDDNYMVILGNAYTRYDTSYYYENEVEKHFPHMPSNRVKAYIYDITDKSDIKEIREVEIEGNYVTSRKIGSSLYMISNAYMAYDVVNKENIPIGPMYRDSYANSHFNKVPYEDIKYIPPIIYPQYLVVGSLDLNSQEAVQVETYLGASDNVYVSQENIYIAVYTNMYRVMPMLDSEEDVAFNPSDYEPKTKIYKFSMDEGKTTYLAKGEVPGNILNQFSMDEHKKSFRIATTRNTRINNEYVSTNNMYILNENMNIEGKLEDLAPEERIYSVRFMGDRGYMVTFKNVDPLFVIDLKDPSHPRVLGKLKIPGYSDYLHPYDENHLIGFGKDTIELPTKDWRGNEVGTNAYYLGMKVALFDVSDVNHPIEKHKVIIGDRGTESELLRDHKALLFDKKRNLLGFPITVCEVKGNRVDSKYGVPAYGEAVFQGAYVYELTPEDGFRLKGKISHTTQEDYLKSGYYFGRESAIRRLLYIGDDLYGVSNKKISAHDMETIKEKNRITIE